MILLIRSVCSQNQSVHAVVLPLRPVKWDELKYISYSRSFRKIQSLSHVLVDVNVNQISSYLVTSGSHWAVRLGHSRA